MEVAGSEIRALLRTGNDVVVHCRGGLGRAGMIGSAASYRIRNGADNRDQASRVVRPGAIETSEQEEYVLRVGSRMR